MTTAILQELPRGAVFEKPTSYSAHHRYEVMTPACEHPDGWVLVRDLSNPGADGFFDYSNPVEVEVLS